MPGPASWPLTAPLSEVQKDFTAALQKLEVGASPSNSRCSLYDTWAAQPVLRLKHFKGHRSLMAAMMRGFGACIVAGLLDVAVAANATATLRGASRPGAEGAVCPGSIGVNGHGDLDEACRCHKYTVYCGYTIDTCKYVYVHIYIYTLHASCILSVSYLCTLTRITSVINHQGYSVVDWLHRQTSIKSTHLHPRFHPNDQCILEQAVRPSWRC